MTRLEEIKAIDTDIREKVERRLKLFESIGRTGTEEDFFLELIFCLMTPQTKARMAEKAVARLIEKNLVFSGSAEKIAAEFDIVRFRYHKAAYIVEAREKCFKNGKPALKSILSEIEDIPSKREWLVKNIKGLGYKEASHFLRNTGHGKNLAILDRHILRNLEAFHVIENAQNLSAKNYIEIEKRMQSFSAEIQIPMDVLDFVLWYREAQDIFK